MCLHATHTKAKLAKEDITVYKVFEKQNREQKREGLFPSFYQCFPYKLGVLYTTKFSHRYTDVSHDIFCGFHAYCDIKNYRGFTRAPIVAKAIIPAGARYYIGMEGDIVSNKIMVTEIIEINE